MSRRDQPLAILRPPDVAEVGSWGAVQVVAPALDAPVIRGEMAGPPPNFAEDERELHARVRGGTGLHKGR